ncbi:uncharacterized protein SOCE26_018760 [Sorangium cellulosum]|uniref:Secreted protein n=1 Tax=Sorangium cellulosum TaxID=56 RepID=A0A2L0EMH4_SORCE|nr:hypothetical protein [Sorangium cellulosum]AUX40475.1 uncharacterized protein SOCE26_018760 [Sorangium cellulosum]
MKARSAIGSLLLWLGAAACGARAASPGPAAVQGPPPVSTPSAAAAPPPVPSERPAAAAPSTDGGAAPEPGAAASQAPPAEEPPAPPTEEEKAAANVPPCTYQAATLVMSLVIEVHDASTKEPLCDATATLTSPQGKEIPTHKPHGDCKSSWVVDAAGKYTVGASHPGYATRTRTVLIERRNCILQAPGFIFSLPPLKRAPPKAVK